MICEKCGAENEQGLVFCGSCGTAVNEAIVVSEGEGAEDLVVRPSQWQWGVYAMPLVVVYAFLMQFDPFSFGLFPVAILAAFIIPRYLQWRGSSYTLSSDSLVIKRGQFGREDKVPVLLEEIDSLEERQGFLGPTLQFTSVHIFLRDGRQGVLPYVPANSPIIERLLAKGITYGAPESGQVDEGDDTGSE